jgi:hypothetical protein
VKNKKAMIEEFKQLESAIQRLKRAEKELDDLRQFQDVFKPEMESIRGKLKQPSKVDEAEQELLKLKERVRQYEQTREKAPVPATPSSAIFPAELGRLYCDVVLIGSGGFARVFRAKRKKDNQDVAVKIPISLDESTGRSFVREISNWQRLNHRNVCKLYDLNIFPTPYMEMELCNGSLDEMAKPVGVEQAANLMFQIADGVKHGHAQGVVHRDLKPHNILLKGVGNVPVVSDWGLSKVAAESKSSKLGGFTPKYAAPEQISQNFGKTDHRTDIYQLGVVFYELVTGVLPHESDEITELMAQITQTEPKKPSQIKAEAIAVEPIIMKCLNKDMKQRYQAVSEMQKDLAEYLKIEFKESLGKSQGDMKRSRYYCAELCLVHLMIGDLGGALKYGRDLDRYAGEEAKRELAGILEEVEFRTKEGQGTSDELVQRVAIVLHQVKMGG